MKIVMSRKILIMNDDIMLDLSGLEILDDIVTETLNHLIIDAKNIIINWKNTRIV